MPDLLVNGCVVTRTTHWWFSPCRLPRASPPQVWLQRSRVGPRNLHCDFYGSGKDTLHRPTPQQGLQGLLQRSPPSRPSLASPHSTSITGHALPPPSLCPRCSPCSAYLSLPLSPCQVPLLLPQGWLGGSLLREACLTAPWRADHPYCVPPPQRETSLRANASG